jgi:glycosyltransferase involved in cell wall biosynthesis
VARSYGLELWAKWQKEIISKTPTLSISKKAVESFKKYGRDVHFLPNFPPLSDIKNITYKKKNETFSSVYIGEDLTLPTKHRNIGFLQDFFSDYDIGELTIIGDRKLKSTQTIKSIGFLPYRDMLETLSSFHVGLIPWLSHPYHEFCLPNKVADYAHAGLPTITSSSLKSVIEILGPYSLVFENPSELPTILKELMKDKEEFIELSKKIVDFARRELIWEKYENNIFNVYENVL